MVPGISRQIITFHFYNWWTHLQRPDAKGAYPSGNYNRDSLKRLLQEVRQVRDRHHIHVYIGEVAIRTDHPNAPRFLRDFTDLCEELDIPLTVHAFREALVWNYEKNPSAWSVLTRWLKRR